MSKTLKTRMKQKHETEANWLKSSLIPLEGELIIYEPDDTHNYSRLKVGDGTTGVNDLPFLNRDIAEQLRRQNDRGVAELNDDEDASSDVLWSSRKTLGVMEQTLATTVGNFLGVNFTLVNGQYVGKKIGPYANYKPGEDYNSFNMYGNRKLVGVDLSNNGFNILGTYNSIADTYDDREYEFFVQQPKFYYKITGTNKDFSIYIADTKIEDDYKVHPAFMRNGREKDYLYIAKDCVAGTPTKANGNAYDGATITSVAKPKTERMTGGWRALSRDGCRTAIKAYNSKLSLYDIWALSASQILFMVEYGTLDVQNTLAEGETKIPHPSTGNYFNKTMQSIGNSGSRGRIILNSSNSMPFSFADNRYYVTFTFESANFINSNIESTTINGITWTVNTDGTITANGTATSESTLYFPTIYLGEYQKYFLNGCPLGGSPADYSLQLEGVSNSFYTRDFGTGCLISLENSGNYKPCAKVYKGTTVNNIVFKPQLKIGTSATDFTPYMTDFSKVKVLKTQNGETTILNGHTDFATGNVSYSTDTEVYATITHQEENGLKLFNDYGTYAYYINYLTGEGDLTSDNSRCVEVSYRWENNLWGGPYKIFVDGMNIKYDVERNEYFPYVSKYPYGYKDDKITGDYIKKSSFGMFWNQGGFPVYFHTDLLKEGLFYGVPIALGDTNTSGIPDYTSYYASTVHYAVPCIGCVYNWETPGGIMGGPGLFQYELVNQNSDQFDSSHTDAYNNYTTAKAIYIP